jgi:hypothetical protein
MPFCDLSYDDILSNISEEVKQAKWVVLSIAQRFRESAGDRCSATMAV